MNAGPYVVEPSQLCMNVHRCHMDTAFACPFRGNNLNFAAEECLVSPALAHNGLQACRIMSLVSGIRGSYTDQIIGCGMHRVVLCDSIMCVGIHVSCDMQKFCQKYARTYIVLHFTVT